MEKELFELLNKADKNEILTMVSMSIEYLSHVYELRFKDIIKNLKDIHKKLMKRGR